MLSVMREATTNSSRSEIPHITNMVRVARAAFTVELSSASCALLPN